MKSKFSQSKSALTGGSVAVAVFIVTVAMHEASRAEALSPTLATTQLIEFTEPLLASAAGTGIWGGPAGSGIWGAASKKVRSTKVVESNPRKAQ